MKCCSKCEKEIADEALFCPECGCPQESEPQNKITIDSSLFWGIVSGIAWLIPKIGIICSIVGIVIGMKKTKKLGLYLSIIGLVLTIINSNVMLSSWGQKYVCKECEKAVTKAYYDLNGNFLCKDCAKNYWIPFDYEKYRVKD